MKRKSTFENDHAAKKRRKYDDEATVNTHNAPDEHGNETGNDHGNAPDDDALIEFQTHRIHVPGEQKSSTRRFDDELNEMIDPFSLAEERSEGRFVAETGLWKREKHAVQDAWLDETIEQQEMGRFVPRKRQQQNDQPTSDNDDDDLDIVALSRENDNIEKHALISILHAMREYQSADEGITLQDMLQLVHEAAESTPQQKDLEKELAVSIAKLSGLPTFTTTDIYSETLEFFDSRMERFREGAPVQWKYKWRPEEENVFGPHTTQEMREWKCGHHFDGFDVQVWRVAGSASAGAAAEDDVDDMFGDDDNEPQDSTNAQEQQDALTDFQPITEVEFELYK